MPALIFDCDGVLADTELDGHLPAFNAAFAEFGLPINWDEATYHRKLQIGGGKERIASEFSPSPAEPGSTEEPTKESASRRVEGQTDLIKRLHARKTQLFTERVANGLLPGRPGVRRLIAAVLELGWTVAVASTSAEASVRAVLEHVVGEDLAAQCHVFAGDIVPAKKPAPDIYLKVVRDLQLEPAYCLVIEDSAIGVAAARAAGLAVIVTISAFTAEEDFTGAALVLDHLGDIDHSLTVVAAPARVRPVGMVTVSDLEDLLAAADVTPTAPVPDPTAPVIPGLTRDPDHQEAP
ncbi:MAG TPA: HAD-IA family hydrolase [Propionicimonas sp.]|nr:HAD-IA family hydrolase [Propionicimonas sp.]